MELLRASLGWPVLGGPGCPFLYIGTWLLFVAASFDNSHKADTFWALEVSVFLYEETSYNTI